MLVFFVAAIALVYLDLGKAQRFTEDCILEPGPFSRCSVSCGGGTKTRTLHVDPNSPGYGRISPRILTEVAKCNTQPCPIDCQLDPGEWCHCSVTCGVGIQTRRSTILHLQVGGGIPCPSESDLVETRSCYKPPCHKTIPKLCNVRYDEWSRCSSSCVGGVQRRQGLLIAVPKLTGYVCPGPDELVETRPCNDLIPCSGTFKDCRFVESAGPCSVTCGSGTQTLVRTIIQRESNGGKPCPLTTAQTTPCERPACPEPEHCQIEFDEWSVCSATCGSGLQQRQGRILAYPTPGGDHCPNPDDLLESRECNIGRQCDNPINCQLDNPSFGACSVTCGDGFKSRTFKIVQHAANGGVPCPPRSLLTETVPCTVSRSCVQPKDCQISYGDWSSCSETCGPNGQESRQGRIISQPQYGGKPCPDESQLIEYRPCSFLPPCPAIDCQLDDGSLGDCSVTCGQGYLTTTFNIRRFPVGNGKPCPELSERTTTVPCFRPACPTSRDCQVEYEPWSECNVSCGPAGTQRRQGYIRAYPQNGGKPCPKNLVDERDCVGLLPCPISTDCICVVKPGPCSVTCGSGTQTLVRTIIHPESNGGKPCPPLTTGQTVPCEQPACPEPQHCQIEFDEWSACSATCGSGLQRRQGHILAYPTPGGNSCPDPNDLVESRECNTGRQCEEPINCQLDNPTFGACSVTCGDGFKSRTFKIIQHAANGGVPCPPSSLLTETVPCTVSRSCVQPKDCEISYGYWLSCSETCGPNGQESRQGHITSQPQYGGKPCPDESQLVEYRPCRNQIPCPAIDCQIERGQFSQCSVTCGSGTKTRTSFIVQQSTFGGKPCPNEADLIETVPCHLSPCPIPVHCEIDYHPWQSCSATCGIGKQERRGFVKRFAQNGGAPCPDEVDLVDSRPCEGFGPCDEPKDCEYILGDFGQCSATCGQGVRQRKIFVVSSAQNGGKPCPQELTLYEDCSTGPCPEPKDCQIRYGPYCECSVNCGGGQQTAKGEITEFPQNGGAACPAPQDLAITRQCNVHSCYTPRIPKDCEVNYGPYSSCSVTCGSGFKYRKGFVSQHPENGGNPCPPDDALLQIETCTIGICPQKEDCRTAKGNYGPCCKKCGGGHKSRLVVVITPSKNGGKPCPSGSLETVSCNEQPCDDELHGEAAIYKQPISSKPMDNLSLIKKILFK